LEGCFLRSLEEVRKLSQNLQFSLRRARLA